MLGSRAYLPWGIPRSVLPRPCLMQVTGLMNLVRCTSAVCREESMNMTDLLCFLFPFSCMSYVANLQRKASHQQPQTVWLGPHRLWYQKVPKTWAQVSCSQQNGVHFLEACSSAIQPCLFFHQPENPEGTCGSGCIMSVGIGKKQERTTVFAILWEPISRARVLLLWKLIHFLSRDPWILGRLLLKG